MSEDNQNQGGQNTQPKQGSGSSEKPPVPPIKLTPNPMSLKKDGVGKGGANLM